MIFDVYFAFVNKEGKTCPGVKAKPYSRERFLDLTKQDWVASKIEAFRNGDANGKLSLPAVCWVGTTQTGFRKAEAMQPTQLVMIDIDHCEDPRKAYYELSGELVPLSENSIEDSCVLAHVTPSGKGLRLIFLSLIHI